MSRRLGVPLAFFCVLLSASAWASPAQLKEGNRLFKNGRYEDALKVYNDALIDQPNSSILHFNAGDAAFAMGDYGKSEKEFQQASQSAIPILKAAGHYNRGNALFREERWADAVEAYKESLRVNPNDQDAKYNLGVALRAQKNPPKSQPKSGQGGGDQNKQPQSGQGDKQDQKSQDQQGSQPKPGQMSREDAERLLAAAGAGEQKKSNQKFPKADVPHPDEDW